MTALRVETLQRYTAEVLARTIADPAARDAALRRQAAAWTKDFDPSSLVTLRKAAVRFDTDLGHVASGPEGTTWGEQLRDFLEALDR